MATEIVGSVTAELILNTGNFNEQITNVRNQVKELNKAFMGSDAKAMAKQIDNLERQLEKSSKVIEQQAELIEQLRNDYEKLGQEYTNVSGKSKDIVKANDNIVKSNEKVVSSAKKIPTAYKDGLPAINEVVNKINEMNKTQGDPRFIDDYIFRMASAEEKLAKIREQASATKGEFTTWIGTIDDVVLKMNQINKSMETVATVDYPMPFDNWIEPIEQVNIEINKMNDYLASLRNVEYGTVPYEGWINPIEQVVTEINRMNEAMAKTKAQTQATFDEMSNALMRWAESISEPIEMSKRQFKQFKNDLEAFTKVYYDLDGQSIFVKRHFQTWVEEMEKANAELEKFSNDFIERHRAMNKTNLDGYKSNLSLIREELRKLELGLDKTATESQVWAESIKSSSVSFQDYYKNIEKATAESNKFVESQQIAGQSSRTLGTTLVQDISALERYRAEMSGATAEENKLSAGADKVASSTKKASSSMSSMTSATNKLKQGMSSLKMVMSTVSSMFIWTFGMSLWEATKQTVTSKNEMESYLNQMGMSKGSISVFNRGLDETVQTFRKLNKYMIGETIAGIGMEFDLSARQMTKAMDVVAMVQNEYVRAGRKEEEATLAVKDILQGEFLRLSRETGVGKQDLIDTGLWGGDLKDIEGLMEALRKVGTDRHWDLFASKCTSLSDVVSTAKNRISEFTATLIDQSSPLIVGAFNGIIDVVDFLTSSWNNMGGTMQMLVSGGLFTGFLTSVLMIGKNMGLVQIATNGFTNSLVAMVLKMDVAQVKSQGLLKSITMAITGFNAETSAGLGTVKMLATRVLGLDANVVATHGFAKAIMVAKEGLVGEEAMAKASTMTHVKLTTVLKESIFTWKALKIAILGVMALGIVAFLGAIAKSCERAKESVDTFYEVVDSGKELIEDAQKTYDSYGEQIEKVNERMEKAGAGTKTYNRLQNEKERLIRNQSQAYTNLKNTQLAQQKAEQYNKEQQERLNNINLDQQDRLTRLYEKQGIAHDEATEKASKYLSEVEMANRIINESYDAYEHSLASATGHMDRHLESLKEANASEEQRNKYIEDYMAESYRVAEYWKEFKQGDFWAIFKIGLGELTKAWIDIANHPEVIKLMNFLSQTFKEMKPYLDAITEALQTLGMYIVQFANFVLSNPIGRAVAGFSGLGLVLSGIGLKIAGVILGGKGMKEMFLSLASKVIPSLKDKLKDLTTTAEETGTVLGGGSSKGKGKKDKNRVGGKYDTKKSPSGKNSPIYTDWSKTDFGTVAKADFLDNARNFLKASTLLAEAMFLVTEAILLINAPMLALAGTGIVFKAVEHQVKKGIEGLQTIAPVMVVLLPPIVTLMVLMDKFGKALSYERIADAGLKSAVGIALGLTLVAETIFMIIPSIIALGSVGAVASAIGDNVQKGVDAMKLVGEALTHLASAVPFLIAGVVLGIAMFESGVVGGVLTVTVIGGIALGMMLSAETVLMMEAPLYAIGQLGEWNVDLGSVRKGAEAIKVCGESLKYLDEASSSLVSIAWDNLSAWVLTGFQGMKDVADGLSEDGGLIDSMNSFAEKFSTLDIKSIDTAKVESLKTLADGVATIGEAIQTVKQSLSNFNNTTTPSEKYAQATGNEVQAGFEGLQQIYDEFENMKIIIGKMSSFSKQINDMDIIGIDEGVTTAISSTANSISQIKTTIDNVKSVMGGIVDSNWASNMASGGLFGAIGGYLMGSTGTGDYVSSFGSSLQSLENSVKDIMTFNSKIQSIVGSGNSGEGGDSSGVISDAVSVVQEIANVISQIKTTLSSGITEIESTAKSMGKSIIDGISSGINEGMNNLSSNVKSKAESAGKDIADGFKKGINPMSTYMSSECDYIAQSIDHKHDGLVEKAGKLAKDMTDAFKKNLEMASPGKMARLVRDEMGYIQGFIIENTDPIVSTIGNLATTMTENFAPSLETDVDVNFTSGDVLSTYQSDSVEAMALANETVSTTETAFGQLDMSTGLTFSNIGTTINTAMDIIATNTKNNYTNIATTTKTQLNNMQTQTTKNIGAIKQSWTGMQTALIQSAEHIRSETGAKINSLQNNMATFWRKVQNPALLLGAGNSSEEKSVKSRRYGSRGSGVRKILQPKGYAGSSSSSRSPLKVAPNSPLQGISSISADKFNDLLKGFKDKRFSSTTPMNALFDYLMCLINGNGECVAGKKCGYAGGWDFNWSDDIKRALLQWHTHFGEIYDPYLYVGKFENDNFPIRGIAPIARNYIYDAISRTQYEYYFDSKYGDPLSIWNAGHFNCYDGAILVMALARALGFPNSTIVHGSWGGTPHVWARIAGLGDIDATAIQGGYGFTAPSRTGAGSPAISRFKHNKTPSNDNGGKGDIHIHIDMSGATVTDDSIGERIGKKVRGEIIDLINPSPSTGY